MYDSRLLRKLIALALDEDLPYGDITSRAIRSDASVRAFIMAREPLVACGVGIASIVFAELGWQVDVEPLVEDGAEVEDGAKILNLFGPGRAIVNAERTILNFMQRLSGIASHVRRTMADSSGVVLLDTRKTTPGWRVLEKYAVSVGGARNHRLGLSDMVMVKNNHIDLSGEDLNTYFETLYATKPYYAPVQVEVRSLEELKRVVPYKPDSVLLDNMSLDQIKSCIEFLREGVWMPSVEVSGRVSPEQARGLGQLGVDTVSTSFLMHGSHPADLSLRILSKAE
jgi:nicotinate-nucleotide pyrophosphorylase (carboxylating)